MKQNGFNERKQRGVPGFPIQLYSVDSNHPQYVMPLHWHKELELVFVHSGQLELFINNQPFVLQAGDIALVNCNHLHRGEPTDCTYDCIVCDLNMLVKNGNERCSSAYINPIMSSELTVEPFLHSNESPLYNRAARLFEVMRDCSQFYELGVMSALFSLFEAFYSCGGVSKSSQSDKSVSQSHRIADMVMWIDRNYTERITLDILSEQSGLTPNYICRVFKEYTGQSPIEYVNGVRIKNVCHDIKRGQKNITEAALDNGYDDISYFCKVFKRHMGMSAKEYKSIT